MAYALTMLLSLDKAFRVIEESEDLLKTCTKESSIIIAQKQASIDYIKGLFYFYKRDADLGIKHAEQSLKLREEYGFTHEIAEPLYVLGLIYSLYKFDYDLAKTYTERSLKLAKESNQKYIIAYTLLIFGMLFALKGEMERSLVYSKRSLAISEELNNKRLIASLFNNIAEVHQRQGNLDQALFYLEKSLLVAEEIESNWNIGNALVSIGFLYITKNDRENAEKYFELLKKFKGQEIISLHDEHYRLHKTLILKMSPRTRNRAKAEELLKEIIEDKRIGVESMTKALVNLCDLLLGELRITNDIEVIDELKPHINQLINIAEKTKSSWILTETYLLQAKLSLITFKIKKAQRFLIQAQQIANRFNLNQLTKKIAKENDDLLKKLDLWEKLKEAGAPIAKRFDLARLDDQIVGMVQNLTMLTPQVTEEKIAIHKEKKICLVCRGEVLRYTYICECGAIYCENCARAVSNLENICWACDEPIDYLKSVKPYKEEEKVEVEKRGKKK